MKPTTRACTDDRMALARRGALSWSGWSDFVTHLSTCPNCRIDWQLSADFDGSAGAAPGDERIVAKAAKAALAATTRAPLGLIRVAFAAGAILAVVAGIASGAMVLHARYAGLASPDGTGVPRAGTDGAGAAHSNAAAGGAVVPRGEPPASAMVDPDPTAELNGKVAGPEGPEPPSAGSPRSTPRSAREAGRSSRRLALAPSRSVDPLPMVAATEPPQFTEAQLLFAQALRQRSHGERDGAIAAFRELQRRFDDTPEALISFISLGELLLGAGATSDALVPFETYLRRDPEGALVPEALAGKARALRALGRAPESEATWREIARRFPGFPRGAIPGTMRGAAAAPSGASP